MLQELSGDVRPGAVHHGNGSFAFGLFAPGKDSVHLIGDFNDWDHGADPMHPTSEGLWWIEKQFDRGLDGVWHVSLRYALMALLREGQLSNFDWDDFEWTIGFFNPMNHGYTSVHMAVNFSPSPQALAVPFPKDGRWHDALGGGGDLSARQLPGGT